MTSNPQCWEFDRYRNGRLMAEGIRITREKSLEMALQAATALADRGDVLVLRSSRETPASHIDAFLAMALPRIGDLMQADPEDASPEGRELMLLADLADRYERQKYPEFAGRPVKPHRSGGGGPPAPEAPIEVLPRQVKTPTEGPL